MLTPMSMSMIVNKKKKIDFFYIHYGKLMFCQSSYNADQDCIIGISVIKSRSLF